MKGQIKMFNSDCLYYNAKEYQDKRKAIMDSYEARLAHLEKMKGSEYYTEETGKAKEEMKAAIAALKTEYIPLFDDSLNCMREANGKRGMKPPTEEELRLVQLLKMKESLTTTELESAANTLKGNATCLSILNEMAIKQGLYGNYARYSENKEMPVDTAEKIIHELSYNLRDFMAEDTSRAARRAREIHGNLYGTPEDATPLPKRNLFTDKQSCYKELTGLSGDELTAFCNAVDSRG